MTRREAQEILLLYRPGADPMTPQVVSALQLVKIDAGMADWWEQQKRLHAVCHAALEKIPVPSHAIAALLQESKTVRPGFWQRPALWITAAAAAVAILGFVVVWNSAHEVPDRFSHYRQRMIGTALRQYRMDIVTNDMSQVRQFLASGGAPADYKLPQGLEKLQLTGAGLLRWRNNPVSMVCFNRGDNQMLYLFVLDRAAVKDPPPMDPEFSEAQTVVVVSWTEQDKVYVLAGPSERGFRQKYL